MPTTDRGILDEIDKLVDEEHALYRRSEEHGGLEPEERERLQQLKVQLDQCWDLLDQRRALRDAGRNPGAARVRDEKTVENYLQ
jgi:hypothetical protein